MKFLIFMIFVLAKYIQNQGFSGSNTSNSSTLNNSNINITSNVNISTNTTPINTNYSQINQTIQNITKEEEIPKSADETFFLNLKCNGPQSCNFRGICINYKFCKCEDYYITITDYDFNRKNVQCNYRQTSQRTTFLLSFFIGATGIDQFYLGNWALGIVKLILPCLILITGAILNVQGTKRERPRLVLFGKILDCVSFITMFVWWLVDVVLTGNNFYTDENNFPLFMDF